MPPCLLTPSFLAPLKIGNLSYCHTQVPNCKWFNFLTEPVGRPPGLTATWPYGCLKGQGSWNFLGVLWVFEVCRCCLECIWSFNVVQCPQPNCSPSTKYVLYSPHPVYVFSPLFPPSRKYVGCPPSQYTFFPCGVPPLHVVLCLCHTWLSLGF